MTEIIVSSVKKIGRKVSVIFAYFGHLSPCSGRPVGLTASTVMAVLGSFHLFLTRADIQEGTAWRGVAGGCFYGFTERLCS
ncbi:hypothetical protein FNH22_31725 [Fulvivirga sp. M361]|uniref:hypothetical protein n=1 Tax=Fulvivirga sp. M361 TaxID=2594266 RepID=UPI00117A0478|nr:hypothetical protein [Fulvivirga sp. M361]TRX44894.1 hypothetical protein FNH22_31725 [Fulvivirga sp. M361]